MPDRELPLPDFPPCIESRVAEAAIRQLRDDPVISGNGLPVDEYELLEILLADTLAAPSFSVILSRASENRSGATRRARLETELLIGAITPRPASRRDTDGYLGRRMLDYVKRVLVREKGVLYDAAEKRITEALIAFRNSDVTLILEESGCLWHPLRVTFTSNIYEATREFVE